MIVTIPTKKYGNISFVTDNENLDLIKNLRLTVVKVKSNDFYIITSDKNKKFIHRLITKAPKGYHVHHKNGNTLDNRLCNLEVLKPKQHSIETSKINSPLSEEQIKDILTSNKSNKSLQLQYNITAQTLSNIQRGKEYAWCCPDIKRRQNINNRRTIKELQEIKYFVFNGVDLKKISKIYNMNLHDLYCMRKGTRYQNIIPTL